MLGVSILLFFVSGRPDSNGRPPGPKPGTLPTALHPDCFLFSESGYTDTINILKIKN